MKKFISVIAAVCCPTLVRSSGSSIAGGLPSGQVASMFVNADGTCQVSSRVVHCLHIATGEYRIEFERFAFNETPVAIVMPLTTNDVTQTVEEISQGACSVSSPCSTTAHGQGWFAQYTFSAGMDAVHNIIAATGY